MAKSKFLKVKCKCGNEQLVFNKASTEVKCLKCKKPLTKPTGGKTEILAEVIENYE